MGAAPTILDASLKDKVVCRSGRSQRKGSISHFYKKKMLGVTDCVCIPAGEMINQLAHEFCSLAGKDWFY